MNTAKIPTKRVQIASVAIGGGAPVAVIAGPCVIESREHTLRLAEAIVKASQATQVPVIFKASYDKANRSSIAAYRGPGIEEGLCILAEVKSQFSVPVLTDVHTEEQARIAAEIVDVIQIPAFLCRQTDLLVAAGKTGKPVNIKKGQFMAPWDMKNACAKVASTGNDQILLTERGASFGYNNLVSDMRSLVVMRESGYPVIFDATHSVQLPGGLGHATGGQRQYIFPLARAAAATGIDALFVETHDDPDRALSDGPNALPLAMLSTLMNQVKELDAWLSTQTMQA
ncbi:MAG: 3-deoxy-8-phosphooctulonate synthase [Candidatus Hydrogenedentota bacterium]|jgi:2-dehydro-3-deoxyphosphooctonate aldolase (KDO 8-P synthase)|uniref:2-dehydro-3-deoxyphosphooctonate aldolase n=1 Tax=Sumerlaea chitinivorans TaxID=2250252 RepID=A0A2Z4Y4Y1_SUMC1|nr:2-Keto-3-deoxy-D-manno-octulosonate-8-phosphate synthase [Candidatus Sumerlaea chitinivorans]MCX7963421.1 3-deoxy-8-phosphooctulonate synthase [Candidatus Sumerlaea chitinivorans]RMH24278.1 MAG: 3-deoxy-8-phosphooctulonate synthase [Candidatus Hydrogenedentota bacterium]GIX45022.1 MAG: 2-dehydro-3-deoxyphosphooctonate aldolase [Candidatus Sumerlaea sp.]